jgi:L-alanine-DL-glutamate epimerase-like enolase superfamily enzyme
MSPAAASGIMEVTGFRFETLAGHLDEPAGSFWEERLSRPVDRYEEFRTETAAENYADDPEAPLPVEGTFLFVETDAGVEGLAGPVSERVARYAADLEGLVAGRDPRPAEKLWDLLYRRERHGRKGEPMHAISAVDVALWDLRGKAAGEPVYRLLGGPVDRERPAYASMLGFSVDPEAVRERVEAFADLGYGAQKWFFRHGPGSGEEGKAHNEALVRAAREAVGDDYDLFFDAWSSWERTYALEMIDRLAPYAPDWLEEPVSPDKQNVYAELREAAPFPVAGGEHEYTRWGAHDLLARGCVDYLQPDTMWAGGLTEMRHVCSVASVHDVPVIPHGHLVPANAHLIAAQPRDRCPYVEYLIKWNEINQFFFVDPLEPEDGVVTVPDRPGLGIELDDAVAEERTVREF